MPTEPYPNVPAFDHAEDCPIWGDRGPCNCKPQPDTASRELREALDVERLAEAMWNSHRDNGDASWTEMTRRKGTISGDNYRTHAARLAREYAALAATEEIES